MAKTLFVKGDIVRARREKPSVFSYLGARPRLQKGELYVISGHESEDCVEYYCVGNDVNLYHSSYFELHQRTIPYREWSEL